MEITKHEWVRLQSLLEPKLFEQLRKYSFDKRISMSEISRLALKKFLKEDGSKEL
jgi:hypothetical protein